MTLRCRIFGHKWGSLHPDVYWVMWQRGRFVPYGPPCVRCGYGADLVDHARSKAMRDAAAYANLRKTCSVCGSDGPYCHAANDQKCGRA